MWETVLQWVETEVHNLHLHWWDPKIDHHLSSPTKTRLPLLAGWSLQSIDIMERNKT